MSGNKLKLWAWLLVLLLTTCKTVKAPAAKKPESKSPSKTEAPKSPPGTKASTRSFRGKTFNVPRFNNDFNVALLLPFRLDQPNPDKNALSRIMLDYYEGVKLAAADLEKEGIIMKLHIFDTKNDTLELKKILAKPELATMNLIIGPVLQAHLNIASEFSLSHNIPMVSPLTSHVELPADNQIYYNCTSTEKTKAKALVDYLNQEFPKDSLYIIHDGSKTDKLYSQVFKESLDKKVKVKHITYTKKHMLDEIGSLSEDSITVFLPTEDEIVKNWVMGRLVGKANVRVLGIEDWLEMRNNDYNFWNTLNVHLAASNFIDNDDSTIIRFRRAYIDKFNAEPGKFSYKAYDQLLFFGEALLTFGPTFSDFVRNTQFNFAQNSFYFISEGRCMENHGVRILKFENYRLQAAD